MGARRKGATPWYLLSNEPGESAEDAWQVVLADAGRWRIEVLFGTLKSELALQRVRVDGWQDRLKLLGLVRRADALLMDLLGKHHKQARDWLMASACQRTGTHLRQVEQPFSRLRVALSTLWLASACWLVRRGRLIL